MDSVYTKIQPLEIIDIESCDTHNRSPLPGQLTNKRPVRRSCIRTCCWITLAIFGVLVALLIGLGVASYVWCFRQVQIWTTTTLPIDSLPMVIVPKEELDFFKDQAKSFVDILQGDAPGFPPLPLIVEQRSLNGLATDSDFLKGHMNTIMKRNEVTIDISLPIDGFPGGKGRYLVGKETLVWDPETSQIHTKLILESNSQTEVFYDAMFSLGKDDKSGRWNLVLRSAYFGPMNWNAPRDLLDKRTNLLDDAYDCDDYDKDCNHVRQILNGIINVDLKEKQVVFLVAAQANMASNRRQLLDKAAGIVSKKLSWKVQLARRLVRF